MFEVEFVEDKKIREKVYSVTTSPYSGRLMFLIFSEGKWNWICAKDYRPVEEED